MYVKINISNFESCLAALQGTAFARLRSIRCRLVALRGDNLGPLAEFRTKLCMHTDWSDVSLQVVLGL